MTIFDKLEQLENEANHFGFVWPNAQMILEQIKSECQEIESLLTHENPSQDHLQEEIGDLIHAAFCLNLFFGFNSQETVSISLRKFEKRFNEMQRLAKENGLSTLEGLSIEKNMEYWNQAKKNVG